ncbi:MAG TPA: argininosuccinate lyase [Thermoanaerobaculia bacterium]|jgi:argininosuccinate lyase
MVSPIRSHETGASLLAQVPHPELFRLLIEPQLRNDYQHVLPCLLRIDAAHVVMLVSTGILDRTVAGDLLAVNRDLDRRLAAGEDILAPPPAHRGLFLLYERQLVERLGAQRGGAAHVARSRNDINATVLRMRLRARVLDLLDESLDLVAAIHDLAGEQLGALMSAFTHLQPAQPATLAHYLAAVATELLRALEMVVAALHGMDRCPMGAASGSGTSFPIAPAMVADLLGFRAAADNSLDAVASRDYVTAILAGFANLGVTLTRWATDFQLWASHAYGFLDWPDDLVSTSSIMPQKRNSYVWEDIRSQAIHPVGALLQIWLGLKNTPFSNSVEVSAGATAHVWPALEGIGKAVRLTRLLVEEVEVRPQRMRSFLQGTGVTMTALADHLVARHGLAFRTAHEAVARLVGELPSGVDPRPEEVRERLEEILREVTGRSISLDANLREALDPEAALLAAAHGGGPAPGTVADQLTRLQAQRQRLVMEVRSWRERLASADARLQQAIQGLASA